MIDYQARFKQKFVKLLLLIFILVPVFFLVLNYTVEKKHDMKTTTLIKNNILFKLRGRVKDITISKNGKTAYVVADTRGIYILDIQNPLKPKILSQFKYFKNSYDKSRSLELTKDEQRIFVRDAQVGIYSIDISYPSKPVLLSSYHGCCTILDISLSQTSDKLYILNKNGFEIVDIGNADEIKTVTRYNGDKKYIDLVEVKEGLVYLASSSGIDMLDIDDGAKPKLVSSFVAVGDIKKLSLSKTKTKAFLSSQNSGVEILDIKNKLNPKSIGLYLNSKVVKDTVISKDEKKIYLLNLDNSLDVVNISEVDNIKLVRTIKTKHKQNHKLFSLALSNNGKTLYMANGAFGIEILELK